LQLHHVWARPGLQVRNPADNKPIPDEGAAAELAVAVELDMFWRRRIADGDVVATELPEEAAPSKPAKKAEA
jgi:hypothetical protein